MFAPERGSKWPRIRPTAPHRRSTGRQAPGAAPSGRALCKNHFATGSSRHLRRPAAGRVTHGAENVESGSPHRPPRLPGARTSTRNCGAPCPARARRRRCGGPGAPSRPRESRGNQPQPTPAAGPGARSHPLSVSHSGDSCHACPRVGGDGPAECLAAACAMRCRPRRSHPAGWRCALVIRAVRRFRPAAPAARSVAVRSQCADIERPAVASEPPPSRAGCNAGTVLSRRCAMQRIPSSPRARRGRAAEHRSVLALRQSHPHALRPPRGSIPLQKLTNQ